MKKNLLRTSASVAVAMLSLVACGGGDDNEAGAAEPLTVDATDVSIPAICDSTAFLSAGAFRVWGGAGPYLVTVGFPPNPSVNWAMTINDTQTTRLMVDVNQQFTVFIRGCMDPGTVTITDLRNKSVRVEVTAVPASA